MPGVKYNKRLDANHTEILDKCRAVGMCVYDLAKYGAYTDSLIGWRGVLALVEIKNPEKLSKPQLEDREKSLTDVERGVLEDSKHHDFPFAIVISFEEIQKFMEELTT